MDSIWKKNETRRQQRSQDQTNEQGCICTRLNQADKFEQDEKRIGDDREQRWSNKRTRYCARKDIVIVLSITTKLWFSFDGWKFLIKSRLLPLWVRQDESHTLECREQLERRNFPQPCYKAMKSHVHKQQWIEKGREAGLDQTIEVAWKRNGKAKIKRKWALSRRGRSYYHTGYLSCSFLFGKRSVRKEISEARGRQRVSFTGDKCRSTSFYFIFTASLAIQFNLSSSSKTPFQKSYLLLHNLICPVYAKLPRLALPVLVLKWVYSFRRKKQVFWLMWYEISD